MFTESPPADYTQWHLPEPEAALLKPGQPAPDFGLSSLDNQRLSLTAYRGKVVWLYLGESTHLPVTRICPVCSPFMKKE